MKKAPTAPTLLSLVLICQLGAVLTYAEEPSELKKLRFEFQVHLAAQDQPLKDLNATYLGYLEKQQTEYKNEGDLRAVLAVDEEIKVIEGEPKEELSSYPELARLQGIYRQQRKALFTGPESARLAVIRQYRKAAEELAAQWTREDRIADAKLALAESERFAAMEKNPALVMTVSKPATTMENQPAVPTSSQDDAPAVATKDTPFVNSLGMKFVPVPITGGPTNGKTVLFSIWETRVRDYKAFLTDTRDRPWPTPDFPQDEDHPAVNISWEDAVAFCEWLTEDGQKTGGIGKNQRYRLPSDHEWSCAVGIGQEEDAALLPIAKNQKLANLFPWGREWPPPKGAGNFYGKETMKNPIEAREPLEAYEDPFERTAPVGSFDPNVFGLHDLGGNVFEWCEDWYSEKKESRVRRSSSWSFFMGPIMLVSSFRGHLSPSHHLNRDNFGFRCVLSD